MAISEAMMNAMTDAAAAMEVVITPNKKAALVYHTKELGADYNTVRFDNHTCNCATFRTYLVCPHMIAAENAMFEAQQIEMHDGAEFEGTGVDPFSRF